ncbi:hypothetical protein LVY72_15790 [Arthrobacter sp. I2-34]|uniref:Uncharacterized protein n=1 Tax=Arthrobacter hankyongi TaxID=2904801 RepID=A0ABS9L9K9_9MICC|nr:hypothetical protein [Arthrobacter hankyongi]MCG2623359.1 hypothetical protein [Arthrobacter hankyongi]
MSINPNTGNYDEDLPPRTGMPEAPFGETVLGETTVPPVRPAEPVATTPSTTPPAAGTATEEAKEVGREGVAAGQHVAEAAKEEAGNVAREAKYQATNLMSQLSDDLSGQASTQQQRAASKLRSLSDELTSMANGQPQSGTALNLVNQAAERFSGIAAWLEKREPGDLLDEIKSFARRRPGAFLALAAGAGLLAGRLTRGMAAEAGGTPGRRPANTGTVPPPPSHVPESGDTYRTAGADTYATTPGAGTYPADSGAAQPPVPPAGTEPATDLPPRAPGEGGERW